jgi:hypothetical protein
MAKKIRGTLYRLKGKETVVASYERFILTATGGAKQKGMVSAITLRVRRKGTLEPLALIDSCSFILGENQFDLEDLARIEAELRKKPAINFSETALIVKAFEENMPEHLKTIKGCS